MERLQLETFQLRTRISSPKKKLMARYHPQILLKLERILARKEEKVFLHHEKVIFCTL
jgi:hypothetical protein